MAFFTWQIEVTSECSDACDQAMTHGFMPNPLPDCALPVSQ